MRFSVVAAAFVVVNSLAHAELLVFDNRDASFVWHVQREFADPVGVPLDIRRAPDQQPSGFGPGTLGALLRQGLFGCEPGSTSIGAPNADVDIALSFDPVVQDCDDICGPFSFRAPLNVANSIGPNSAFAWTSEASVAAGYCGPAFSLDAGHVIGLRVTLSGRVHFGWIALADQPDPLIALPIAWGFETTPGVPAHVRIPNACVCDADTSGDVDVTDLLAFLDAWFVETVSADVNGDGAIDAADLLAFLDCWFDVTNHAVAC